MKPSLIRVITAEYVKAYQIRFRFSDGVEKVVDFSRWLQGDVFKPLSNKRQFKRFFVAGGTVSWPNGADIAPETLRNCEEASTDVADLAAERTLGRRKTLLKEGLASVRAIDRSGEQQTS